MMRAFPGQRLMQSPIANANVQNDMLDATEDFKRRQLGGKTETIRGKKLTDIVQIRNLSEADQARGKVLQLGVLLLDELDNDQLWFAADLLADPADRRYCILREPIVDAEVGDAQVAGCCLAWVDVTDIEHTAAKTVSGETDLASAESGPFEILSPLTETGLQEVAVRFSPPRAMGFFQGILLDDFVAGDSLVSCDHVHATDGGPSPLDDPEDEDEVVPLHNVTGFTGVLGNLVKFYWNQYTQQHEIFDTDNNCEEA